MCSGATSTFVRGGGEIKFRRTGAGGTSPFVEIFFKKKNAVIYQGLK